MFIEGKDIYVFVETSQFYKTWLVVVWELAPWCLNCLHDYLVKYLVMGVLKRCVCTASQSAGHSLWLMSFLCIYTGPYAVCLTWYMMYSLDLVQNPKAKFCAIHFKGLIITTAARCIVKVFHSEGEFNICWQTSLICFISTSAEVESNKRVLFPYQVEEQTPLQLHP